MKRTLFILCCLFCIKATAQEHTPHSNMWLKAFPKSDAQVNYQYDGTGTEYKVSWGMDTAWDWDYNVRRGTNHIGKENLSTGRISFQPSDLVDESGNLSSAQTQALRSRINHIKLSGVKDVVLNCDHEALNSTNYYGKPQEWYKVIKASVKFAQAMGMNIVSILPFNEPDYTPWGEGTKAHFKEIARLIKEDTFFDGIRICGGNTLNCDEAYSWYNYMKPYIDEGNTHQLAGSFDNYANFFQTVRSEGKVATGDELHNSMEAFVGAHYGMQNGIWWGFDGVARGDICKATNGGVELGYGENRSAWAAGAVYRLPSGQVEAFAGVSERQANKNRMDFVSTDRDVFYEGYGPVRLYQQFLPGDGVYGSDNQKNADRVIHIHAGDDVPSDTIGGEYVIMNKKTRRVIGFSNAPSSGAAVNQQTFVKSRKYLGWTITPTPCTKGGDFSYYYVKNLQNTNMYLNVLNNSLVVGGTFIAYNAGGDINEQYCFEYAGDGYYYIRSHLSGLYLEAVSTTGVRQNTFTGDDIQKWRLQPTDASCEQLAPAVPAGLAAKAYPASVRLTWTANADADISSYIVLRGEEKDGVTSWETIGRRISGTTFIDNSCVQGHAYSYKIRAVDHSGNRSESCEPVACAPTAEKALIAEYEFDTNQFDETPNHFDGVSAGGMTFSTALKKSGTNSLAFDGTDDYMMLPPAVANMDEMSISAWVNNGATGTNWMRVFDFGNGTDQYMFYTPNNGSESRFVMKNGGDEQILSAPKLGSGWKYLTITIGGGKVQLYVNAELVASSDQFTIKPSDIKPSLCFVGRSQFPRDPLFKGRLDDMRIYNYVIPQTQIAEDMEDLETAIETVSTGSASPVVSTEYFSLGGVRVVPSSTKMPVIVLERHADGSVTTRKEIR